VNQTHMANADAAGAVLMPESYTILLFPFAAS
jgi:hypothetical protein